MKPLSIVVACVPMLLGVVAKDAHALDAGAPKGAQTPLTPQMPGAASVKWNWVPSGQTERFGHSEVRVRAPVSFVRSELRDFAHYREFAPDKFKMVRVVAKKGPDTDLYMQIPIMHGLVVLWQVLRFGPPREVSPGVEVHDGQFVRGNVKTARIWLTSRAVNENESVVSCDLLLLPDVPAPQEAIDEELRDAAQNAVDALQKRAEAKFKPAASPAAAP